MVIGAGAADAGADVVAINASGRPATAAPSTQPMVRTPDRALVVEMPPSRTCRFPPLDSSESLTRSMITHFVDCENVNLTSGYRRFQMEIGTTGQYETTGFVTVTRS